MPRGRPRKSNPNIPAHVDQASIPKGMYWDPTGNGRWYVFVDKEGLPARKTVAGPTARLSELHAISEVQRGSSPMGTVSWILQRYHAGTHFATLSPGTQKSYYSSRKFLEDYLIRPGHKFGDLIAARLTQTNIQRLHEKVTATGKPTKANHLLRYMRAVFSWAGPHLGFNGNPARGVRQAKERKLRRLPPQEVYDAIINYAKERGQRKPHVAGSCPPYLWVVAEIGYLCRLRGIETATLVESQGEPVGLRVIRRKGSRDNIVEWSPRLREAWDAALALRKGVLGKRKQPDQLRPENRFLILSEDGEPLTKHGLDSAWQRLIKSAIKDAVITADQRFGLHDLKRKGGTDTPGNIADKQDALGVSAPMMKVYDHSVPVVKTSEPR